MPPWKMRASLSGDPMGVARVLTFLASDEASYTRGQNLHAVAQTKAFGESVTTWIEQVIKVEPQTFRIAVKKDRKNTGNYAPYS